MKYKIVLFSDFYRILEKMRI